jgi:hypothetical protein
MVLQWLLDTAATESPYEPGAGVFGTHLIPSHALVIVLSPLLDPRTGAMLARLTRSGRFVIAVDTLGNTQVRLPPAPYIQVAHRLWTLERANLIGQLREHGVPVVEWAGAGSLDTVLRDVSRLATGPRVGVR